jgi:chitinase
LGASTSIATIVNDDSPTLNLSPATLSQNEGNSGLTAFTYTVSLDRVSDKAITVAYGTSNGTATSGSDYVPTGGTLTFEPGALTRTIVVDSIGDTLVEADETFGVSLFNVTNATLGTASASSTILNDDIPLPVASLTPASISNFERSSGLQAYSFTVNLDKASDKIIQIGYSTDDGTATLAGSDYVNNDRTLTFKAGETSKVINVQVRGDRIREANEFFTLSLNDGINTTINSSSSRATINILDDDNIPVVSTYSKTLAFTEGNNPRFPKNVSFAVELSSAVTKNVTVNYSLLSGTAKVNEDYLGTTGALTFRAGETFKYLSVPIIGDTLVEANETFTLRLDRANDALLNPNALTTRGIIFNDDRATTSIRGLSDYLGSSASINRDELLRSSSDVFPVNTGLAN